MILGIFLPFRTTIPTAIRSVPSRTGRLFYAIDFFAAHDAGLSTAASTSRSSRFADGFRHQGASVAHLILRALCSSTGMEPETVFIAGFFCIDIFPEQFR